MTREIHDDRRLPVVTIVGVTCADCGRAMLFAVPEVDTRGHVLSAVPAALWARGACEGTRGHWTCYVCTARDPGAALARQSLQSRRSAPEVLGVSEWERARWGQR